LPWGVEDRTGLEVEDFDCSTVEEGDGVPPSDRDTRGEVERDGLEDTLPGGRVAVA